MLCIDYDWEEVGWRRSCQPTSSQKPNLLIACHSERSEESNKLKKLIQTIFYRSVVFKNNKKTTASMNAVVFCLLILNEKLFVDMYFKVLFFFNVVLTFYKQYNFAPNGALKTLYNQ